MKERLVGVVERGRFLLGPEVEAFEREFAAYLGVRHVVSVANGTEAITIALRALGVRPGDDVVVPSFTFYATVEAVIAAGARPVFCDVDPETRNLTADTVRAALTARTKAIVAVDLFGSPAPLRPRRDAARTSSRLRRGSPTRSATSAAPRHRQVASIARPCPRGW